MKYSFTFSFTFANIEKFSFILIRPSYKLDGYCGGRLFRKIYGSFLASITLSFYLAF